MRKLILKMSISVDGFVGGPNGEIDWLLKTLDKDSTDWILETLWAAGLHIMGSRTFHDMIAYWPFSSEPLAAPMNEIPKLVFSRKESLDVANEAKKTTAFRDAEALAALRGLDMSKSNATVSPTWINAGIASGELSKEIMDLKKKPGKDILAHGGASFAQSLVKQNLIDEYRLLVHSVALGKGLPLFGSLTNGLPLKLIRSTAFRSGSIANVYQPVNPLS